MNPRVRQELMQLLSDLCDGELTEARHARLEQVLNADPECRRQYLEYVDMHARLLVPPRLCGGETLPPEGEPPDTAPGGNLPGLRTHPASSEASSSGGGRRRQARQFLRYALVAAGTLA